MSCKSKRRANHGLESLEHPAFVDQNPFDRRVRERPASSGGRVPAIALTAYAREEDRDRSIAAGFQVHLSKPVDLAALLTTVAGLAKTKAARE